MIVALYKVWRGEEFVEASIESIYHFVGKIIVLSSDIGWNGKTGNTVKPVVEKWKEENDCQNKITIVDYNCTDQDKQYKYGIQYIKENCKQCEHIMLIDTDEVWDEENLRRAAWYLRLFDGVYDNFKCMCHGYIKSPLYRLIHEKSECKPPAFVSISCDFKGIRGNKTEPSFLMSNVYFHHFSVIRETYELVLEKFQLSSIGDLGVKMVDMDKWKREVWDEIPNGKMYHYNLGSEHVWPGVEEVQLSDLPPTVRKHPFLSRRN